MRRSTRLEASVGQGHVGESFREHQVKTDQCIALIERLENRLRTQTWYHELSDQGNDDEIDRMVGDRPRPAPPRHAVMRAKAPTGELDRWVNQLQEEVQTQGMESYVFHQRVSDFSRNSKEAKPGIELHWNSELLNSDMSSMTETAMSFTRVHQEFQGRGARFEQLHRLIHNGLRSEVNEFQNRLDCKGARVAQVTREHEQFSSDVGDAIAGDMPAQEDLRV